MFATSSNKLLSSVARDVFSRTTRKGDSFPAPHALKDTRPRGLKVLQTPLPPPFVIGARRGPALLRGLSGQDRSILISLFH